MRTPGSVAKKSKSDFTISIRSSKTADLPATRGMLKSVKTELKAEFKKSSSRLESRMDQLENSVLDSVSRMELFYEEQRSDNRIVLEAIVGINQRLERLERFRA